MKAFGLIMLCIVFAAAAPAGAEFYRYTDEQGRTRYTDDINQVPAAQRARIKSYVGTDSAAGQTPPAAGTEAQPATAAPAAQSAAAPPLDGGGDPDAAAEQTRSRIEEMKKQLDSEFQAMAKEKEALAKEKEASKSREEIMAYNKKVEAFNLRAEQYEKQGGELRKLVQEYNTRLVEEGNNQLNSVKK